MILINNEVFYGIHKNYKGKFGKGTHLLCYFKQQRYSSFKQKKAQNAPMAWTNYAVFYNGKYISNEILNEKRFLNLIEKLKK